RADALGGGIAVLPGSLQPADRRNSGDVRCRGGYAALTSADGAARSISLGRPGYEWNDMSFENQNDPLEQMLGAHLSRQLDPQLGKAAASFAGHVMRNPDLAKKKDVAHVSHRHWWQPVASIGAVAAAVLLAYSLISYRITHQPITP